MTDHTFPLVSIPESLDHQPDAPKATSRERGDWQGATIDIHSLNRNFMLDAPALDHHVLAYCIEGSGKLRQTRAGQSHESIIRKGSLIIMPAGLECAWRGASAAHIRTRLPRRILDDAASEIGNKPSRGAELLNIFHTRDDVVGHLSTVLAGELDRPPHPAQSLVVDACSCALAAHLLRCYDPFGERSARATGLAPRSLSHVLAYVEDTETFPITLEDLARIANVSKFHFARLFKTSMGMSPIAYVEQSRIARAQSLIRAGHLSLAEIALSVGFVDQSHFTRRFQLHIGCTPAVYAHNFGIRYLPRRRA